MSSARVVNVDSKKLVMKFGGTSVGSVEAIRRAARIVIDNLAEWPQTVVVLSAMSGVTNQLIEGSTTASEGNTARAFEIADELRERHKKTARELLSDSEVLDPVLVHIDRLVDEFRNLCGAIGVLGEATPRALDSVSSIGERISVQIFSALLNVMGVKARSIESTDLIVTDGNFQAAHPRWSATRTKVQQHLVPSLNGGEVPVVTGFMGATETGITTTLGRGGSDYSAAILAAALMADEVWIWTDVDGVMTADPRIVPGARTIPSLSYLELAELAYFGAKVLHPLTIRPVVEAGIGLKIKNTFKPEHPGTSLEGPDGRVSAGRTVKAVTSIRGQTLVTIEGSGMLGVPGVAARTFGAVAATGTSVILIVQASSEQSISFAVATTVAQKVISALEDAFAKELANREIDRISASVETGIITVVGAGMRHVPGVAGRVFSALGAQQVNVIAIAQGSSEVGISMVVEATDLEKAVKSLHELTA